MFNLHRKSSREGGKIVTETFPAIYNYDIILKKLRHNLPSRWSNTYNGAIEFVSTNESLGLKSVDQSRT